MTRLAGDPGPVRWFVFAVGFRLPAENRDWVRHELTDSGWRLRTVRRHLAVIIPICVIIGFALSVLLPSSGWLALGMVALILSGSIFTVAAGADELRASRLRQHGIDVPGEREPS